MNCEGILNDLLWGDRMWFSRLAGTPNPTQPSIGDSVTEVPEWPQFLLARADMDMRIQAWARSLTDADPSVDLRWFSGVVGCKVSKPIGLVVSHVFNHGTHHPGQVHAMLTAAGARTDDTDLFLMPRGQRASSGEVFGLS